MESIENLSEEDIKDMMDRKKDTTTKLKRAKTMKAFDQNVIRDERDQFLSSSSRSSISGQEANNNPGTTTNDHNHNKPLGGYLKNQVMKRKVVSLFQLRSVLPPQSSS